MMQSVDMNWVILGAVVLIVLLIALWLMGRASRAVPRRERRPDVLDEGAVPAQRNQALIDSAPPAAAAFAVPPAAELMGGVAEVIAAAVQEEAAQAGGIEMGTGMPDRPVDDLTRIKGLGPKAHSVLAGLGIHRFAQLAALDPAQAAEVDSRLGAFKGRIFRDRWIDQARYLEQDDTAGFEKEFGKLG